MTVPAVLSKLDVPMENKSLKTAKIEITPLSRDGYKKLQESRKITEKDIEKIRAEARAQGASDEEVELAIGLAQAMDATDEPLAENAIAFSGERNDFDRIYRVELLRKDGTPLNTPSRGTSTRGDSAVMTLQFSEAPPADAALQLLLLTDKSRLSFPFDVKVQLP